MNLEQQIETTMARAADGIGAAGITADEILHKGRSARVRRRTRRAAAGVAAVVLAVVATLTATNLPGRTTQVPVGPTSPAWPFPTSPAQSGPNATSLGIGYANGTLIVPARGTPIRMSLPPRTYLVRGVRVVGGWIVNAQSAINFAVDGWFQPDDGSAPARLANSAWAVSGDRRTLVVAGRNEPTLTAYRLPSMQKLADTRIPSDDTAVIGGIQIVGDSAYAMYGLRGASPFRVARWNLVTNLATNLAVSVGTWGTSGDTVLRVIDNGNESCVDTVPIAHFDEPGTSGVCSTYLDRAPGVLSPDGRQAIVVGGDTEPDLLVTTQDLHAGVWRPTTVTGAKHFIGWDSATSFLAYGDGDPATVLRCTAPDACSPIGLPPGEPRIAFLSDDLS